MWCDHTYFHKIVGRVWRTPVIGGHMFKVYQRLKLLKVKLRHLNRREFNMISEKVISCKRSLGDLHEKM